MTAQKLIDLIAHEIHNLELSKTISSLPPNEVLDAYTDGMIEAYHRAIEGIKQIDTQQTQWLADDNDDDDEDY